MQFEKVQGTKNLQDVLCGDCGTQVSSTLRIFVRTHCLRFTYSTVVMPELTKQILQEEISNFDELAKKFL